MNKGLAIFFAYMVLIWGTIGGAQQSPKLQEGKTPNSMPGMDMSNAPHQDSAQPQNGVQQSGGEDQQAELAATQAMSMANMNMNLHMFMTTLRPRNTKDDQRAKEIVDTLRQSILKYKDYKLALADGYKIFLPNAPQEQYHFTLYRNAFVATFAFDPARPTSLLYKKTKDGYELIGAMYTAPRNSTLDDLNDRVPLSVAEWHKHVNFCMPPKGTPSQQVDWKKFGLGSIATKSACDQAGGRWIPQIFNWMVHVYPFETDPNKIWAHM
jgi:hypothetical protein